ncbi:MAG: AI-2E family transporter [Actinomycetota bacterium]|nr:AI-2E family transporter [Actinomycetota bacterium]
MTTDRTHIKVPRGLATTAAYSWRFLVIGGAALVLVYALVTLRLVVIPIFVALLLSTLLVPVKNALRRRGLPSLLATWLTMLLAIGVVAGAIYFVVPQVADELETLGQEARRGAEDVITWLTEGPLDLTRQEVDRYIDEASSQLSAQRGSLISGAFKGAYVVLELIAGILLTMVLVFFFVKDGDRIANTFLGLFGEERREDVREVGSRSWTALGAYIRGTAIVGLVDALFIGGGLLIMGVPLVVPLTIITFFAAFFPLVGAVVAGILATLVALVTKGFVAAAVIAGITIVVQQVEGDVLQPIVLGRAVNLHPLVILLSLTGGAIIAGVAGAFLAVPMAAVTTVVVSYMRSKKRPPPQEVAA